MKEKKILKISTTYNFLHSQESEIISFLNGMKLNACGIDAITIKIVPTVVSYQCRIMNKCLNWMQYYK